MRCVSARPNDVIRTRFREAYFRDVSSAAETILGRRTGRGRQWLLEPLRYTHAKRRNFFRTGILLESVIASDRPDAGPFLSACAEIGWSCALILDDIRDGSDEREGTPSAHRVYGSARCIIAALTGLVLIAWELMWRGTASTRERFGRIKMGVALVISAAIGELAHPPRTLIQFREVASRVNSSIHWAVLSPHCGTPKTALCGALERYAHHSAIAGKMRNDLLDYWGGASERDATLEDFRRRSVSFPIIVLFESNLNMDDRNSLADYFASRGTLAPLDLFMMFQKYSTKKRCMDLLSKEIKASNLAIKTLALERRTERLHLTLIRWNQFMFETCRAQLFAHS